MSHTEQKLEKFYQFLTHTFAEHPKIKSLSANASLYELWSQLAVITDLTQQELAEKIAAKIGLAGHSSIHIDEAAMRDFPASFIQKNGIAPIAVKGQDVVVAIANPFDDDLIKQINFVTSQKAVLSVCSPSAIEEAMHEYFSNSQQMQSKQGVLIIQKGHPASTNEHSIIVLARKLLTKAVTESASDLHIQPYLGGGEVRERVDGLLRRVALLPQSVYEQICRYFKAASDMDPSNDRIPQDGRLSLKIDNVDFELRISTLPAKGGERLVIRFLDQEREFNLANSGIATAEIQKLRQMVVNPSGIILLTGPTGSGKTTTLYSLLGEIDSPNINIITIENPVESTIPTISQVDVNEKAGLTFANVMRSVLRQDPDVILLGEIRDRETASVATSAALTGHLVLSTVHTNDAVSAITRLEELGVERSVIADALTGVVSQRLCRKLCEACKQATPESLLPEEEAFRQMTKIKPASRKNGCPVCDFTGYAGRLPVIEILDLSSVSDKQAIKSGDIFSLKAKKGVLNNFESIASSAAKHIISGETTVEEVCRVIGGQFWQSLSDEYSVAIPEVGTSGVSQIIKRGKDAILLLSQDHTKLDLAMTTNSQWIDFINVKTSTEAKEQLKSKPEIVFVIVDIPDHLSDTEVVSFIHNARIDMAWSRLPALLLLPENRGHLEQLLRNDGAISPCLEKPINDVKVHELVKNALSE